MRSLKKKDVMSNGFHDLADDWKKADMTGLWLRGSVFAHCLSNAVMLADFQADGR